MRAVIFSETLVIFLFASFSLSTENNDERIFNGHSTGTATTKHQVSLRLKMSDEFYFGLGFLCGGSLISPNGVLTAAHCLRDFSDNPVNATEIIVAMGNLVKNVRTSDTLVFNVTKYVSHPNYNRTTISFDIAYILLDGKVPAQHPAIQPINLINTKLPFDTICEVSGWGFTEEEIPSDDLLAVDVRIIDINVCNQGYEGSLNVTGKLCAGYMTGEKDACSGDSGGPLVCNGQLTGIVSFGKGCGMINKPGIYTDVLYFKDWIRTVSGKGNKVSHVHLLLLLFCILHCIVVTSVVD